MKNKIKKKNLQNMEQYYFLQYVSLLCQSYKKPTLTNVCIQHLLKFTYLNYSLSLIASSKTCIL